MTYPILCRRICLPFLFCLLLLLPTPAILAMESEATPSAGIIVTAESSVAARGKKYRASVQFQGETQQSAAAFRLHLSYDENYLTLSSIESGTGMSTTDFRYTANSSDATVVFASVNRTVSMTDGVCCTFVFDVNEDAAVGSTNLVVTMDQIVDSNLVKLPGTYTTGMLIEMERILSNDALLTALTPSAGELTPNFSPEITEYTLSVPYEVTELTFDVQTKDGGTYRVNRKNLNRAEVPTTYIIKVTSENGKSVTEYVVTATRSAKLATSSGSGSTGGGTTSSRRSASSSSGGTTSRKSASDGSTTQATDEQDTTTNGTIGQTANGGYTGTTLYGNRNITYNDPTGIVFVVGFLTAAVCALTITVIFLVKHRGNENTSGNAGRKKPKH